MGEFIEKGIFIHTENSKVPMLECLISLHTSCSDVKFTSAVCDNEFHGYRVHFSQPDAKTMLRKKYKLPSGSPISVYPLTTCLMFHNFNPEESEALQYDFRKVVQERFGKILNQRLITDRGNQQASVVDIDIPEIKSLSNFSKDGRPNMEIKLSKLSKTLKVTFWCRHCEKHGHTYQECFAKNKSKTSNVSEESKGSPNEKNIEMQARQEKKEKPLSLAKSIRNLNVSNYLESNNIFASKIGEEQVLKSGFLQADKEILGQPSQTAEELLLQLKGSNNDFPNNNTVPTVQVKQEIDDENIGSNQNKEVKQTENQNQEMSESDKDPVKEEPDSFEDQLTDQNTLPFPPDDDDDIQIISGDSSCSDNVRPGTSKLLTSFGKNEPERRKPSSAKETSPQPASGYLPFFPKSSTLVDISSPGMISPRQQPRPSTSHEVSNVLSDQLKECFSMAYEETPVLDLKTLDAFLIHVKKKSNPKRVASNYTKDVEGLKTQLQGILHFYYNRPQTGTKDDIQFIKWLNGLVDRFEGTVSRKRKRTAKNNEENPLTKMSFNSSRG